MGLKGYAYSGGGRKVIRSEISLDDGKTWRLAQLKHTEKPNAYGKYWCWCHWSLEINVLDLIGIEEISLRSWDEGMNTQPKDITWNVMGMMNNCHFRVKVHHIKHQGKIALQFEHPTVAANCPGGWMVPKKSAMDPVPKTQEAQKETPKTAAAPASSKEASGAATFTLDEIAKHKTEESAWFIHDNKVYDATSYLADHPGGAESSSSLQGRTPPRSSMRFTRPRPETCSQSTSSALSAKRTPP